jgi:hypothetical protein
VAVGGTLETFVEGSTSPPAQLLHQRHHPQVHLSAPPRSVGRVHCHRTAVSHRSLESGMRYQVKREQTFILTRSSAVYSGSSLNLQETVPSLIDGSLAREERSHSDSSRVCPSLLGDLLTFRFTNLFPVIRLWWRSTQSRVSWV